MIRFFFIFMTLTLHIWLDASQRNEPPLFVRIIYESGNRGGQYKDYQILKKELNALNCEVEAASDIIVETPPQRVADINIFIELPSDQYLPYAKENYLIPNPECFYKDVESIPKFDKILCKTKDTKKIFSSLHSNLYFLGFTSQDCLNKKVKKDYSKIWHGPGKSPHKNTNAIVELWKKRRDYPPITIVHRLFYAHIHVPKDDPLIKNIDSYVEEKEYIRLQNEYGIHLCPSFSEGFGHYIVEAMSTRAVVITTNAPPMNEFIKDPRCLVAYSKKEPYRLGFFYHVDLQNFEKVFDHVRALPKEELKRIGEKNRELYLKQKADFKKRIKTLINIYRKKHL